MYNDHFLPLLVITVKVKNVYGIFYTLYCDDPSCVRLSFKFGPKKTENRFDPLVYFTLYIVTTLAALGSVLNLDKKKLKTDSIL